jgi:hypothetical protein
VAGGRAGERDGVNERAVELARGASATGPHPAGAVFDHERLDRYL